MMACGALYLSEHETAATMHAASLQLISEVNMDPEKFRESKGMFLLYLPGYPLLTDLCSA